jgi:hypothetical protein
MLLFVTETADEKRAQAQARAKTLKEDGRTEKNPGPLGNENTNEMSGVQVVEKNPGPVVAVPPPSPAAQQLFKFEPVPLRSEDQMMRVVTALDFPSQFAVDPLVSLFVAHSGYAGLRISSSIGVDGTTRWLFTAYVGARPCLMRPIISLVVKINNLIRSTGNYLVFRTDVWTADLDQAAALVQFANPSAQWTPEQVWLFSLCSLKLCGFDGGCDVLVACLSAWDDVNTSGNVIANDNAYALAA